MKAQNKSGKRMYHSQEEINMLINWGEQCGGIHTMEGRLFLSKCKGNGASQEHLTARIQVKQQIDLGFDDDASSQHVTSHNIAHTNILETAEEKEARILAELEALSDTDLDAFFLLDAQE